MIQRVRQAGEGKLGCMIWLAAFAISALIAYKMVPVRVQAAQLKDFMSEQAKYSRAGNDKLEQAIVNRAKELGLPVKKENVKVDLRTKRVRMSCKFVVPIEFPGYTYNWSFNLEIDEPRFRV